MLVQMIDSEKRKIGGQGITKETCNLVAQKLVATYTEIAGMHKGTLQKLYT